MLTAMSGTLPADPPAPPAGERAAGLESEDSSGAEGLFAMVLAAQAFAIPSDQAPEGVLATGDIRAVATTGAFVAGTQWANALPAPLSLTVQTDVAPPGSGGMHSDHAKSAPKVSLSGNGLGTPVLPPGLQAGSEDPAGGQILSEDTPAAPVLDTQAGVATGRAPIAAGPSAADPAVSDQPADPAPDPSRGSGQTLSADTEMPSGDRAADMSRGGADGPTNRSSSAGTSGDAAAAELRALGADAERPSVVAGELTPQPSRLVHPVSDVRSSDASATTALPPRPDAAAPSPAAQLAEVAQRLPDGPVEISLSPEELGRVRMSLVGGEGQIAVQIVAERPETLDLLRRHIDMLANELRGQGFSDVSFSFGQGGPSGDGGHSSATTEGEALERPATDQLGVVPPEKGRSRTPGGLDLRI